MTPRDIVDRTSRWTVLIAMLVACGSAAQEQRQRTYAELSRYVFEQPLGTVWPIAVKIFAANVPRYRDAGDHRLESVWERREYSYARIVVEGHALDTRRCQVFFFTERRRFDSPTPTESLSGGLQEPLELRLIREFSPEDAARLDRTE